MALLETTPRLVQDDQHRVYSYPPIGSRQYRIEYFREYRWRCDATGGETTHEGTYATDGYSLTDSGRELPHGKVTGWWWEQYRKFGAWVAET